MATSSPWPSASDYSTAIQNPQNCFGDPELKTGKPQCDAIWGLPIGLSGNFAVVYKLQTKTRNVAVRCFIRPVTNQEQRYNALSQYFSRLSVSVLVDFAYLPEGIRIRGQWYPIVRMAWVPDKHLHRYIEEHLSEQRALEKLAATWRGAVSPFPGLHAAHGDLQHGNILVDPSGNIHFVDYDGFYIPALQGSPPGEVGHANYQHPKRTEEGQPGFGYYAEGVDAFSALVIYLSLLALKADPGLWKDFHNGENLIFLSNDFKNPGQTPLWKKLDQSSDSEVVRLSAALRAFCQGDVSVMPDLESVILGLSVTAQTRRSISSGVSIPAPEVAQAPIQTRRGGLARVRAAVLVVLLLIAVGIVARPVFTEINSFIQVQSHPIQEDWVVYQKPSDGFSIALPPRWRQFDMDPNTIQTSLQDAKGQNPGSAAFIDAFASSLRSGQLLFKFFGVDFAPEALAPGNNPASVFVLKQAIPQWQSLDACVQSVLNDIENTPGVVRPISNRRINLPAGETAEVRYRMSVNGAAGQVATASANYILVKNGWVYLIQLVAVAEEEGRYASVFEKIAQSFRFVR